VSAHLSDRQLSDLIDGEPVAATVTAHLEGCPACARTLAVWADTLARVGAVEPPAPGAREAAVASALAAFDGVGEAPPRPRAGRLAAALAAAAAAVLAVGVGLGVARHGGSPAGDHRAAVTAPVAGPSAGSAAAGGAAGGGPSAAAGTRPLPALAPVTGPAPLVAALGEAAGDSTTAVAPPPGCPPGTGAPPASERAVLVLAAGVTYRGTAAVAYDYRLASGGHRAVVLADGGCRVLLSVGF
jgi:hypothetical protein